MVWQLDNTEREEFERNPLSQVVCQLRFHPILKVVDRVAEFQERIRGSFPEFIQQKMQVAAMTAVGSLELQQEQQFLFKKVNGASTLTLTTNALSLDERDHTSRDVFLGDIGLAIDALKETHSAVTPKRLGVRYINIIDVNQISADLGEAVDWSTVITEPFLQMPSGVASLEQTLFYSEIRSPTQSNGEITLRYGLLSESGNPPKFRFDIDRYHVARFELANIPALLDEFVKDIYSLFRAAAGDSLLKWMKADKEAINGIR